MMLFVWLLYLARDVLTALLLAIVFSTAFDHIVSYLEKKRIPRILGTIIIYLGAIFVFGLIIYTFVPLALSELNNLLAYADKILGPAAESEKIKAALETLKFDIGRITDLLFSGDISIVDLTSKVLGGLLYVLAIFAISFYLTVGRGGVEKFLIAILPHDYEAKVIGIYTRVNHKIGRWLTGQLFASVIMAGATFIGLWLLGVKYSLFLGIMAGVLELIPYVGPILTGGLAVLIGLGDSASLAVYALILFTVLQQLESHVLIPMVMKYTITLNPVVTMTALLIGGTVFGIPGMILSVPIAVMFQEIVEDWAGTKQARRGLGL